jgi:hypothetical protein
MSHPYQPRSRCLKYDTAFHFLFCPDCLPDRVVDLMYPYIRNYVYFKDLSQYGSNIYPLFHFILSCDTADQIGSAHFRDITISIFHDAIIDSCLSCKGFRCPRAS